jgi:histone H3/H4
MPGTLNVGKETKEVLAKTVTVFISCLTTLYKRSNQRATDSCKAHGRKTLSADDIFNALAKMDLDQSLNGRLKVAVNGIFM